MDLIAMPDSENVNDLPAGAAAYLGYADGDKPTAVQLAGLFPEAHRVILTVTGGTLEADGCDAETGDLTPESAAEWVARKLDSAPGSRPVIYASVSWMPAVLGALEQNDIPRDLVRLLSAHWTKEPHVCGPASCGAIDIPMDGTQWTASYRLASGPVIDMSWLNADFFQTQPASTETEKIVQELGIVRQGATGETVKTVQGLCLARGYLVGPMGTDDIDGVFGPDTEAAVKRLQSHSKLAVDGVVGPLTWPVLLGIA